MISDAHKTDRLISTVSARVTTEGACAARCSPKPVTVMFMGDWLPANPHALESACSTYGSASVPWMKQMRLGISKDLPHDAEGRAENLRRSALSFPLNNDLVSSAAQLSSQVSTPANISSASSAMKIAS